MWHKLKHIFSPNGEYPWMESHASNPTAQHLHDGVHRIYFSSRDKENRAHVGYVDVDFDADFSVVDVADQPVIVPGKIGAFDDNGISIGCMLNVDGKERIYYLGWNLAANVPFRNSIGMVQQNEATGAFERLSDGPLMDRDFTDPFSISYPFILKDGEEYKMWYGSHKQWGRTTDDMIHPLKLATSKDGINWHRTGIICIDTTETDYAFSRPFVLKENGVYKMWYSFRGGKYRIGYAESTDGMNWERKDQEVGIDVSAEGWDDQMICYPWILDYKGKRYLLYNGNGYGKTGIGIAEWR